MRGACAYTSRANIYHICLETESEPAACLAQIRRSTACKGRTLGPSGSRWGGLCGSYRSVCVSACAWERERACERESEKAEEREPQAERRSSGARGGRESERERARVWTRGEREQRPSRSARLRDGRHGKYKYMLARERTALGTVIRGSHGSRALRSQTTAPVSANDERVKTFLARGERTWWVLSDGRRKKKIATPGSCYVTAACCPVSSPSVKRFLRPQQVTLNRSAASSSHTRCRQTHQRAERAAGSARAEVTECIYPESVFFFYLTQKRLSPLHTQSCVRVRVCVCPWLHASHTPAGIMHRFWESVR